MKLEDLGYNAILEKFRIENKLTDFEIGRIIAEHKERYIVKTSNNEMEAEITGNLRYTATGREDFPAVGDWVAFIPVDDNFAVIHKIFPRFSVIKRQAVGQFGEIQIIAANIDYGFIVQAVDRDFSINRLERYLTICYSSKVNPIIVLSKTDLINKERLEEMVASIQHRIENVPLIAISNENLNGMDKLTAIIEKGKTYCLLGSSGVGKSTLINNLSGNVVMKTGTISESTNRGKHVTTHRELHVLENGGIFIDNPGMREVGIADSGEGLETTYNRIFELAKNCRYLDCTHVNEPGCAVIAAVERGEIEQSSYDNYLKMEREKAHFESSVADKRRRDKMFGKMMKDYKKKDVKNRKGK